MRRVLAAWARPAAGTVEGQAGQWKPEPPGHPAAGLILKQVPSSIFSTRPAEQERGRSSRPRSRHRPLRQICSSSNRKRALAAVRNGLRESRGHLGRADGGEGLETFLQETFRIMLNSTSTLFQIRGNCSQRETLRGGGRPRHSGPHRRGPSDPLTEPSRPSTNHPVCVQG